MVQKTKPSCVTQEDEKTVINHFLTQQNFFKINEEKNDESKKFQPSEISLRKFITNNGFNPIMNVKKHNNIKSNMINTSDLKENINIKAFKEKLESPLSNNLGIAFDIKYKHYKEESRQPLRSIVENKKINEEKHVDIEQIMSIFS